GLSVNCKAVEASVFRIVIVVLNLNAKRCDKLCAVLKYQMYISLNFHTVCKGYLSLYYIPVITPQNIACADSQSIGCLFFTVFVYVLYVLISRIYRASGDFSCSLYFAQVINSSVIIDNSVVDDCSVVNYCSVYI